MSALPSTLRAGDMSSRRQESTGPNWAKIGAISGVVAVLVTIIITILPALLDEDPTPTPTLSTPNVMTRGTFENPTNQEEVRGNALLAKGSVEGVSSSSHLLCIVKNELSDYYPYEAHIANGEWIADVGIGPENINRRFTFTLILATATPAAFDELRQLREANPDDYYDNGIPNLPDGIEPIEEVVFYRMP